jgi:hypothetical protein
MVRHVGRVSRALGDACQRALGVSERTRTLEEQVSALAHAAATLYADDNDHSRMSELSKWVSWGAQSTSELARVHLDVDEYANQMRALCKTLDELLSRCDVPQSEAPAWSADVTTRVDAAQAYLEGANKAISSAVAFATGVRSRAHGMQSALAGFQRAKVCHEGRRSPKRASVNEPRFALAEAYQRPPSPRPSVRTGPARKLVATGAAQRALEWPVQINEDGTHGNAALLAREAARSATDETQVVGVANAAAEGAGAAEDATFRTAAAEGAVKLSDATLGQPLLRNPYAIITQERPSQGGGLSHLYGEVEAARRFKQADKDGDGKLSRVEWSAAMRLAEEDKAEEESGEEESGEEGSEVVEKEEEEEEEGGG